MKRCKIRVQGIKRPPHKIKIRPGTTTSDVLTHLKLNENYVLSPLSDPTKTFTPEEALYDYIKNDERLIAKLIPEAVDKYAHIFFK